MARTMLASGQNGIERHVDPQIEPEGVHLPATLPCDRQRLTLAGASGDRCKIHGNAYRHALATKNRPLLTALRHGQMTL